MHYSAAFAAEEWPFGAPLLWQQLVLRLRRCVLKRLLHELRAEVLLPLPAQLLLQLLLRWLWLVQQPSQSQLRRLAPELLLLIV